MTPTSPNHYMSNLDDAGTAYTIDIVDSNGEAITGLKVHSHTCSWIYAEDEDGVKAWFNLGHAALITINEL